jgi:PAS domain S-box-containing protein
MGGGSRQQVVAALGPWVACVVVVLAVASLERVWPAFVAGSPILWCCWLVVVAVLFRRAQQHAAREAAAHQAAEDARLRFQSVFDQTVDLMILVDDEFAIVDANRASSDFFAKDTKALVGSPSSNLVAPRDRADWPERWGALRTGKPRHSEVSLVGPDGAARLFEVTVSPNVRAHLHLAVLRDIETRRRAEHRVRFLNEASDALASSVDCDVTLATVVNLAVPRIADWAAVDMVTPDGCFRRVALAHPDPEKAAQATELRRRHPFRLDEPSGVARVVRSGVAEICERISDDELARAFPDPESLAMARSFGILSSMCVPLRVQGLPVGAIWFGFAASRRQFQREDLTFAQELAHRANVALENARNFRESQEANRVKDEFLATISHELRTPLNAILGWTTMLRRKPDVDAKKALDTIERNARAQMRLVEDVLDVSRAVTGKLTIEPAEIDVGEVLRAAVEVVRPMADARSVSLDVRIEPAPCPLYADADRLQQAFWNVLSNAIKFSGKTGRVTAHLTRTTSSVELAIADTGRGIHPTFLPYVFDRFRQADSSTTRAEGGLGLGLAIVRHIVELHGGTVKADSAGEGKGTTFTLWLPVRAVQPSSGPSPMRAPKASSGVYLSSGASDPNKGLSGIRVLVCDDDEDARELVAAVLSAEGAAVYTAATGGRAIAALREFVPHVLVSDVGMPQVDGYQLIRQIRSMPEEEGGQTPAIALTAYARREDELKAFLAGYQIHVAKPVEPSRLVQMVANLAGRTSPTNDRGTGVR